MRNLLTKSMAVRAAKRRSVALARSKESRMVDAAHERGRLAGFRDALDRLAGKPKTDENVTYIQGVPENRYFVVSIPSGIMRQHRVLRAVERRVVFEGPPPYCHRHVYGWFTWEPG